MNKEAFEIAVKLARYKTDETIIDSYQDHANDCTVLITTNYNKIYISNFVIMQEMSPREDPFIEAFKSITLALHEHEKASDSQQADEPS